MRIALFGGAFDPPHLGHQRVTAELLSQGLVDEVWYVPVKHHPFGKTVSSDADRTAMLELVLIPGTRIEMYELEREQPSYSLATMMALVERFPAHEFSWVIGSDNLAQFDQWYHYQELLKFPFFVYPRQGFPLEPLFPNMQPIKGVEEVAVSSSQVRELLKQGAAIANLVDPTVVEYIEHHHLYVVA